MAEIHEKAPKGQYKLPLYYAISNVSYTVFANNCGSKISAY